jgi:hypothetical protein
LSDSRLENSVISSEYNRGWKHECVNSLWWNSNVESYSDKAVWDTAVVDEAW